MHLYQSGPLTLGETAKHFNRSISATTEITKRIEKQGWITRVADPEDARVKFVWLTQKGEAALLEATSVLSLERVSARFKQMSEIEINKVIKGLSIFLDSK